MLRWENGLKLLEVGPVLSYKYGLVSASNLQTLASIIANKWLKYSN